MLICTASPLLPQPGIVSSRVHLGEKHFHVEMQIPSSFNVSAPKLYSTLPLNSVQQWAPQFSATRLPSWLIYSNSNNRMRPLAHWVTQGGASDNNGRVGNLMLRQQTSSLMMLLLAYHDLDVHHTTLFESVAGQCHNDICLSVLLLVGTVGWRPNLVFALLVWRRSLSSAQRIKFIHTSSLCAPSGALERTAYVLIHKQVHTGTFILFSASLSSLYCLHTVLHLFQAKSLEHAAQSCQSKIVMSLLASQKKGTDLSTSIPITEMNILTRGLSQNVNNKCQWQTMG